MSVISQGPKEAKILPGTNGATATDGMTAEEYGMLLSTVTKAFRRRYPEAFAQRIAELGLTEQPTAVADSWLEFAGALKASPLKDDIRDAIAEARRISNNRRTWQ